MQGDTFMRAYRLVLGCLLIGVLWALREQVSDIVRFVLSLRTL
jgi:hypothetical protein